MKKYIKNAISNYSNHADMSHEDKLALINNPNTPIEQLVAMLEEPDDDIYRRVWAVLSSNENTPADIIESIYALDNDDLNWNIATNPNTPIDIIRQIANEEDGIVLQNPNCPIDILEQYADTDEDYYIYNMSCNPNCPSEFLHNFIKYAYDDVLLNIANHPNTSMSDLRKLSKDSDEDVAKAAQANLKRRKQ